jgi:hypothetical protein
MFKSRSIKFKMQAKTNGEHALVNICMAELCKKAGFADSKNMVQRDLVYLSERIESQTGVLISLSTIKRLLNGQFSRVPQIATLDAIAVTAGYQNWQDFKLTKSQVYVRNGNGLAENTPVQTGNSNTVFGARAYVWTAFFILATIAFWVIMTTGKSSLGNTGKARFSAKKVTGNDIPNTVVFSYNIDSVQADSFFIQQSWDKNRRIRVYKHNYTLTDIYYEPGYHTAKLIANDKIIKTVDVSIPTNRWFFYAKEGIAKGQPKYILPANGFKHGLLRLTTDDLLKNRIDIQKENIFLNVYFPSGIENSSDNFVLKFRIKVDVLKNDPCPYFATEVFCQHYFMFFTSTLKGCASDLFGQFGENVLNGKTSDLSALGSDVKNWQNVEFKVQNRNVSISINNKKIFSSGYHNSCGLITGLGFISNGLCEVDSLNLKTISGKDIYPAGFER